MKTDVLIQQAVLDALHYEPSLNPGEIGVMVRDGVVTLLGKVESLPKKQLAAHTARAVKGVKAIVEKIDIQPKQETARTDRQLLDDVTRALKQNETLDAKQISIEATDGIVTLSGIVKWNYQRQAAHHEASRVPGVKNVFNHLTLQSAAHDMVEKEMIEEAMARHWSLSAQEVRISVDKNTVTLSGEVESLYQKDEAERLAWKADGVQHVDNQLKIVHKAF